jgi:hypothetical protein
METTNSSQWPTGSILAYGTFGTRTPAGKRYRLRATAALAAFTILWLLSIYLWKTHVSPNLLWGTIGAIAPGLTFSFVAWETHRYWLSLDELARRLQLEAAAWTYLVGIAAGMLLGGFSFVFYNSASVWFWCSPMWVILLEPIRAFVLYRLAKRY